MEHATDPTRFRDLRRLSRRQDIFPVPRAPPPGENAELSESQRGPMTPAIMLYATTEASGVSTPSPRRASRPPSPAPSQRVSYTKIGELAPPAAITSVNPHVEHPADRQPHLYDAHVHQQSLNHVNAEPRHSAATNSSEQPPPQPQPQPPAPQPLPQSLPPAAATHVQQAVAPGRPALQTQQSVQPVQPPADPQPSVVSSAQQPHVTHAPVPAKTASTQKPRRPSSPAPSTAHHAAPPAAPIPPATPVAPALPAPAAPTDGRTTPVKQMATSGRASPALVSPSPRSTVRRSPSANKTLGRTSATAGNATHSAVATPNSATAAELAATRQRQKVLSDLERAEATVRKAVQGLQTLDRVKDVTELKGYANPPETVRTILMAVALLLGEKDTWPSARKVASDLKFIDRVANTEVAKFAAQQDCVERLQQVANDPKVDAMSSTGRACGALASWLKAAHEYAVAYAAATKPPSPTPPPPPAPPVVPPESPAVVAQVVETAPTTAGPTVSGSTTLRSKSPGLQTMRGTSPKPPLARHTPPANKSSAPARDAKQARTTPPRAPVIVPPTKQHSVTLRPPSPRRAVSPTPVAATPGSGTQTPPRSNQSKSTLSPSGYSPEPHSRHIDFNISLGSVSPAQFPSPISSPAPLEPIPGGPPAKSGRFFHIASSASDDDPYARLLDRAAQLQITDETFDPVRWLSWLHHYQAMGNYEAVKQMRLIVQRGTLAAFRDRSYRLPNGGRVTFVPERGTQAKLRFPTLPTQVPNDAQANVLVFTADVLDVGLYFQQVGNNVVVINASNSHTPGGCYLHGNAGLEESIFRRSNMHEFLDSHEGYSLYPIFDNECVYSSGVTVIRSGECDGYRFLQAPQQIAFLSCPPLVRPKLQVAEGIEVLETEAAQLVLAKFNGMLELAAQKGHNAVVIPAFGCFNEGNPPAHVARLLHTSLTQFGFRHRFKLIAIACIEGSHDVSSDFEGLFGRARQLAGVREG
eukprot:TRINITY_DN15805_c0_g1_i2.p1 TRINITY_DN15805_c0_g1~~TRINITY_DN15805_c0_g1_i2.p1  ORF type:complete len:1046 (+),score=109.14 TRINITY_DN15805_c0_g1_i2:201-3140(+)